jgi:hypothetical protein
MDEKQRTTTSSAGRNNKDDIKWMKAEEYNNN